MAEAALAAVGIEALAGGSALGGGATWRRLRITLVNGARGRCYKVSLVATGTRPVGQGGGPARPAECTARPSAHAVRMVSVAKVAVAHSRPEETLSVATSRLRRLPEPTRRLAGKYDR